MSLSQNIGVLPRERHVARGESERVGPEVVQGLGGPVRLAIGRTRQWLLSQQCPDGSWCAELEGDTILESETILLLAFLGETGADPFCATTEQAWCPPPSRSGKRCLSPFPELAQQAAAYLVEKQLPEGGWAMYPGGKLEISGSVKAYFALKLTGHDPSAEYMQRARSAILAHGGADAVNSFTRFYLALLGQISYEQCPAVPPEAVLLPKWFPVNLYAVSSWSRTIIVPLSIVWAKQPVRPVDPRLGIRELFLKEPKDWPALRCPGLPGGTGWLSWDRLFRTVDGMLKWCRRHRCTPLRKRAMAKATKWMLDRFEHSDGLGAIYPPIVWSIVALRSFGYEDDSPELQECYRQLNALVIEDADKGTARLQPCKSPVWDTALTLRALSASGVKPCCPAVGKAVEWLLNKQITRSGDWAQTVKAEPGGWCFEYANDFYPDSDDTAMVLMALHAEFGCAPDPLQMLPAELRLLEDAVEAADEATEKVATLEQTTAAIERGLRWMLAMQNDDGGWGAFDRNNDRQFFCYVPFADHNAMIDPSTPDLTGRVLEALGKLGRRVGDPAVDRAVAYMRRTQQADGSWLGRWGVNYIYGTWQAIAGLVEVGVPTDDPAVAAGANWLLAHQQACGAWGESPDSYDHPHLRGQGTATASQTAWALLGLLAAGYRDHPSVARAVRFLLISQNDDGTWTEPEFTGTGFPRVFYLRYHYYPIYFPLLALAQWAVTVGPQLAAEARPTLRLVGDRVRETEDGISRQYR